MLFGVETSEWFDLVKDLIGVVNTILIVWIGAKLEVVHKGVNSKMDALLAARGAEQRAKGKEEGRAEGEEKAAILAKGVKQGQKEPRK